MSENQRAFFRIDVAVPAPEDHLVEVVLRSAEPPLDAAVRGHVVRSRRAADGAWLTAIRFDRIPSAIERELVRFCFQKEAETARRVSHVRISVAIPAVVEAEDGALHSSSTVNLRADGTRAAAPCPVTEGEEVRVRFDERWFGRDLILSGRVTTVDRYGADLVFDDVSRADRAAINRVVIAEERRQRRMSA